MVCSPPQLLLAWPSDNREVGCNLLSKPSTLTRMRSALERSSQVFVLISVILTPVLSMMACRCSIALCAGCTKYHHGPDSRVLLSTDYRPKQRVQAFHQTCRTRGMAAVTARRSLEPTTTARALPPASTLPGQVSKFLWRGSHAQLRCAGACAQTPPSELRSLAR